jgi:glutathione S-transferase
VHNKTPEFLAKFPHGQIPAFEGKDGFLLFEGVAICQYCESSPPPTVRSSIQGEGSLGWIQGHWGSGLRNRNFHHHHVNDLVLTIFYLQLLH